jgi:hypothetical protein
VLKALKSENEMKSHKYTFLMLAIFLAVVSCAKHKATDKAEEGKKGGDTAGATTGATAGATAGATTGGTGGATTGGATGGDTGGEGLKGQLVLGGKLGESKADKMLNLLSSAASTDDGLGKQLIPAATRFKAVDAPNEAIVKISSDYDVATKKLTVTKGKAAVKVVNVKADGKVESVDVKTITKAPVLKIQDQAIELASDDKAKEFSSKADKTLDIADAGKPITSVLSSDDEKLKIAESKMELSPIVLIGTQDAVSNELVLDLSKGDLSTDLLFKSSYAGADGDPTKPECVLISQKGLGDVKPIYLYNVINLSQADHQLDLSKLDKATVAKIPAGSTDLEIQCIRQKMDKSPNGIALTITKGLKLKVIQAEVKKEPKKEEPKK